MLKRPELITILACPDCKVSVDVGNDVLVCSQCGRQYPLQNGIPIMFSVHSESVSDYGSWAFGSVNDEDGESKTSKVPFYRRFPDLFLRPAAHDLAFDQYFGRPKEGTLFLNLGSGTERVLEQKNVFINLDIYPHHNVDIVGDAHHLPFLPDSFDGVYACAVFEHLLNPFQAAAEVTAITKPGGLVMVAAPFIFPIHGPGYTGDYFRFTDQGLRQLFWEFEEVECKAHGLPTRGMLALLRAYAGAFSDNRYISYALAYAFSWLFNPFKWLDRYLAAKKNAYPVSSSFYFVGRKRAK
jgi:uncharacterized protein YbaR (Trm112 family)